MVFNCCGGESDDTESSVKRKPIDENGSLEEPLVSSRDDVHANEEECTDAGTEFTYNQLLLQGGSGSDTSINSVMPSWTVFETVSHCYHCEAEFESLGLMSVVDDVFSSVSGKMSKFFSPSTSGTSKSMLQRSSSPTDNGNGKLKKRHHCRRCRNCFCDGCANRREVILLLLVDSAATNPVEYENEDSIGVQKDMKPQRVCQRCYEDLKLENKYFQGRKFLNEGQGFKKTEMMGMISKLVTLKVNRNYKMLSLRSGFDASPEEEGKDDVRHVPLSQIDKVELKGLTSFDIIWRESNSSSVHTWCFEGDTHQTASTWVWYLAEACRRSRTPSLKHAVELERRQREEKDRRVDKERERQEAISAKRAERHKAREGVSRKYSRSKGDNSSM